MPTPYIQKLHDEHKGSIAELEKKWADAKAQAEKQDQGNNYAYITKIFQQMVGASTVFATLKTSGHGHVVAREDRRLAKCMISSCQVCASEAAQLEATFKPSLNAAARLLATSCDSE